MNQKEQKRQETEIAYQKAISSFKPKFGDQEDIRAMKLIQQLANKGHSMTDEDRENLQQRVIYLTSKNL